MEITGKIKKIDETKTYGASGFRKREVVVETNEQYSQPLLVEFVQDKCDLLNNFNLGQEVKISINLRGREWINPKGEAVYFNSIQGWRIEALSTATNSDVPDLPPLEDFDSVSDFDTDEPDDLPF